MTRYESHINCLREMSKTCPLVAELADDFESLIELMRHSLEQCKEPREYPNHAVLACMLNKEYSLHEKE